LPATRQLTPELSTFQDTLETTKTASLWLLQVKVFLCLSVTLW